MLKIDEKKKKIVFKNIFKIIIILLIILCIAFGSYKLYLYLINREYFKYEEKMNTYGFNILYNNASANTYEYVGKSEALKIIISAVLGENDLSSYQIYSDFNQFKNEDFVDYAEEKNILAVEEINKDNCEEKASYINVIKYLSGANINILDKEIDENIEVLFKNYNTFSNEEKYYIKDAIYSKVIDNKKVNFNKNKKVTKGMLNKIIVNFVENNNLLTINGEEINKDNTTMPSNASDYPYTLKSVENSVYEIPNYSFLEAGGVANDIYVDKKNYYQQISYNVEKYFDIILNVDYNTIDANTLWNSLWDLATFEVELEDAQKYVDFVKENKIKITGSAKVQLPCIYHDGFGYRARTKIEYNIENSNINKNLIFADFKNETDVEYSLGKNTQIIDVPIYTKMNSMGMYVTIKPLIKSVAGNVKDIYSYYENTEY